MHSIHVNGIKGKPSLVPIEVKANSINGVGEINKGETSVQVTGLKPAHFYNIRVIASSSANFSTLGQLIRLRTLASPGVKALGSSNAEANETIEPPEFNEAAAVRPAAAQYELNKPPTMARETSAGAIPSKRTVSGRRNSPAFQIAEQAPSHVALVERNEAEGTVEQLTRRLESLRQEQQDLDRQIQEEETQSRKSIAELTKERDRLRQVLKEKEDATAELRRQGNQLDKHHRLAQSRKAQKEQLLNQKKAERQKMKDDIARWDTEIVIMRQDTQDLMNQKADVVSAKDQDVLQWRQKIEEGQAAIKALEEDIRAKGIEIKAMEKDREQFSDGGDEVQELAKQDRDDDRAWEFSMLAKHGEYDRLWQTNQQVRTSVFNHDLEEY